MFKLKTDLPISEITKPQQIIDYQSSILFLGSCFVEHIGQRLSDLRFQTLVNPFGTLFQPLAIEKVLNDAILLNHYTEQDLIFDQNLWHSPHHHSQFSKTNSKEVLENLNKAMLETSVFLQKTSHLVITLGTAWVYHHIPTDQFVANCHKIPQNQFIKRILSVSEVEKSLLNSIHFVQKINPNIQIILTLSPVRHLKDGFQNNARSKAHLLTAIHQMVDQEKVFYFPAFELLTDDLRDYRFYTNDMIHPSEMAVEYVWEYFKKVWLSTDTQLVTDKVAQLQRDLQHKPFHLQSENYQQFLKNIESQKMELAEKYGIFF